MYGRVLDQKDPHMIQGGTAERIVTAGFAQLKADAGLEPLSVVIDEGDQRGRNVENHRREPRDAIEALLGAGVEYVQPGELGQATFLIGDRAAGESRFRILGFDHVALLSEQPIGEARPSR